ncbi:aspartate--tRNA ligase [Streptococcaceae bacterium ESL0729]|nr:aspartate--tRNA ligase [Streptococcaceae bacterium ESL0729]
MGKTYVGNYGLDQVGQEVKVQGWIANIRNHGKLSFIELRDRAGILQVFIDNSLDNFEEIIRLKKESIIEIFGQVVKRKERFVNPNIASGQVELRAQKIKLLSSSKDLPFELDDYTRTGDDLRQRYRYLDLRRRKMTENILLRHQVTKSIRNFLNSESFIDIETPYLGKSTPEGARDFLVPSRLQKEQFYALPQSPQMLKQLLMGAGFDRYYQLVRCFRDEDLRGDRQPEFTQVDLEVSFASQEEIQNLVERMLKAVVKEVKGVELAKAFPQISYEEAMRRFGSDKPDTRFEMELKDLTDFERDNPSLFIQKALKSDDGMLGALVLKEGAKRYSKREIEQLKKYLLEFGIDGFASSQIADKSFGGSLKSMFKGHSAELLSYLEADDGDLVFLASGVKDRVRKALGALRLRLAKENDLIDEEALNFLWVVDWPLLEWNPDEKRYQAMHHPFTKSCASSPEELKHEPENQKSYAYDIVLNGYEIGGGSLRIHEREMQEVMFELLGMEKAEYERDFAFFLEALDFAFPPHGGLALGLDRLIMLLAKEDNIREVMAFPKNGMGRDLMVESPALVAEDQLRELSL